MTRRELLRSKRNAILDVASRHGASNVRLFGSVARGEESSGSDIDLLIKLDPDRSLLDHIALQQELSALLGAPVDVVEEGGIS
ncbi:MAG: nucleotidyltransferase family protein, partial [Planctomycetes bacterium]|nr:nucleotidyltransferase family protein [Planctomycetota bacterium]